MKTNNFNLPAPYEVGPNAVSTPMFTPKPVAMNFPIQTPGTVASIAPVVPAPTPRRVQGGAVNTFNYNTNSSQTQPTVPVVPVVPGSANSAAVQAGMYQSGLTPEQQALQTQLLSNQQATATQVLDPNQEYQNQLKNYQAQIDSINSMYSDRLNQARIQGQGRIESRQFAQGRSGQIGSGVGEAGVNAVQDANAQVENSIREEQANAISEVYAKVRSGADASLAAKTLAKQAGADKLLEYLNNVPGEKKKATSGTVAELLARGVDVTHMTPEEIKSYTSGLGISEEQLKSEFSTQSKILAADKAKAEQTKAKADADLAKTKADTAKLISDVNNWGKLTEYQKGQLKNEGIKNAQDFQVAKEKAGTEKSLNKVTVETNINKNIAAAQADGQWDNWSKDEKNRFIRAMGGLPSDYGI